MDKNFDANEVRQFLERRETEEQEKKETERQATLRAVVTCLKKIFFRTNVEIYLVGSITKPYMFRSDSDIDIVLKNFKGDRFDIWTQLEASMKRNVEIILFENCHFQEHVLKEGYKIL